MTTDWLKTRGFEGSSSDRDTEKMNSMNSTQISALLPEHRHKNHPQHKKVRTYLRSICCRYLTQPRLRFPTRREALAHCVRALWKLMKCPLMFAA